MRRPKGEAPPKPGVLEIRAARPLTADRDEDPLSCCNVCHLTSAELGVWRECDEHDKPIAGDAAIIFIGKDHPNCQGILDRHPRLYVEEEGSPGSWPRICGPCRRRQGFRCLHPDLKANGGAGLHAEPDVLFACTRPRSKSVRIRTWVRCAGLDTRQPPPAESP